MNLVIEKNIPMPVDRNWPNSVQTQLRDTLRKMEVGDSFFYESEDRHTYLAAKKLNYRITTHKLATGGWRVWLKSKER